MERIEYPKILGPYMRHVDGPEKNKLNIGAWVNPTLATLRNLPWTWTEKINGTNVRIFWDGHKVSYGGRSDTAFLSAKLIEVLGDMFPEEVMEQTFGSNPATLFGEGCGPNMAPGSGVYSTIPTFIMFDAYIDGWWLERPSVLDIGRKLGVYVVPTYDLGGGTVEDAIELVGSGLVSHFSTKANTFFAEGLVGTAPHGILDRGGKRIQVKVKHKDFFKRDH